MGRYISIIIALLIGVILGVIASQLLSGYSQKTEPLLDAPDAPDVDFKMWTNGNWAFKLSGTNNESTAQMAMLENKVLPFKIMANGAAEPKFFQLDVAGVPHRPYSTVTLVGDAQEGFINEVELWSEQKIYRFKRTRAGGAWVLKEARLKK